MCTVLSCCLGTMFVFFPLLKYAKRDDFNGEYLEFLSFLANVSLPWEVRIAILAHYFPFNTVAELWTSSSLLFLYLHLAEGNMWPFPCLELGAGFYTWCSKPWGPLKSMSSQVTCSILSKDVYQLSPLLPHWIFQPCLDWKRSPCSILKEICRASDLSGRAVQASLTPGSVQIAQCGLGSCEAQPIFTIAHVWMIK